MLRWTFDDGQFQRDLPFRAHACHSLARVMQVSNFAQSNRRFLFTLKNPIKYFIYQSMPLFAKGSPPHIQVLISCVYGVFSFVDVSITM